MKKDKNTWLMGSSSTDKIVIVLRVFLALVLLLGAVGIVYYNQITVIITIIII